MYLFIYISNYLPVIYITDALCSDDQVYEYIKNTIIKSKKGLKVGQNNTELRNILDDCEKLIDKIHDGIEVNLDLPLFTNNNTNTNNDNKKSKKKSNISKKEKESILNPNVKNKIIAKGKSKKYLSSDDDDDLSDDSGDYEKLNR
jgi:hypothetical protein